MVDELAGNAALPVARHGGDGSQRAAAVAMVLALGRTHDSAAVPVDCQNKILPLEVHGVDLDGADDGLNRLLVGGSGRADHNHGNRLLGAWRLCADRTPASTPPVYPLGASRPPARWPGLCSCA